MEFGLFFKWSLKEEWNHWLSQSDVNSLSIHIIVYNIKNKKSII